MAISTSLSSQGYGILKESLSVHELAALRTELTVAPFVPKDFQAVQKPAPFKVFVESTKKIYVPKAYGLKKFGPPKVNKMVAESYTDISVPFAGRLRQEQQPAVDQLLVACRDPLRMGGILNVFCGGGKTTMALYCITKLAKKTLIIVHKDFLLNQWKERIDAFVPDARVGLIKAKVIDVKNKDIVLASLQSLSMKEYDPAVFDGFGTVVIDEVHHTSAEVFSQALRKVCFPYTIGLSATINRKDGLGKVFMWHLGEVVYRSTKRVDDVDVHVHDYYDHSPSYSTEHYIMGDKPNMARMINNICAFEPRTQFVIKELECVLQAEPNRRVLILSDRRNHLERMHKALKERGYDVGLYYGGLKLEECENKPIIVATFAIAAEGYDQPGLDTLVLASPKSDVVQAVGRILRDKPQDRKHTPLIIDIVDNFSIFRSQGQKRTKYYRSMGYTITLNGSCEGVDDIAPTSLIPSGICLL